MGETLSKNLLGSTIFSFTRESNYLVECCVSEMGFFKDVESKRRSKENTGPILTEDGCLLNRD